MFFRRFRISLVRFFVLSNLAVILLLEGVWKKMELRARDQDSLVEMDSHMVSRWSKKELENIPLSSVQLLNL